MFLFWLIADFDPHNYSLSRSLNLGKRQARHRDRFNSLPAARPDVSVWGRRLTLALQVKISLSGPVFSGARGRARSSLRARNPAPLSCDLRQSSAGDWVFNCPGVREAQVRECGDARDEFAVPAGSSNAPGHFELLRRQGREGTVGEGQPRSCTLFQSSSRC